MDNDKKVEVSTKSSIAVQLATGIAILALVTAGSGLVAHLAVPSFRSQIGFGGGPGPFSLLSPASGSVDQDDSVTLTWQRSTSGGAERDITKASPWSFIKTANATHRVMTYDVYLGPTADGMSRIATVSSTSYTATDLLPGTQYSWRIRANNGHGTRYSGTWTFTTAGANWISDLGYIPVDDAAACGGNRECDADGILSCAEFNAVWLSCSGTTNRCPDNLEAQCLQQSLCQCSGVPAGGDACTTFLTTFTDPCSI